MTENEKAQYSLKRPGLFAVKAILENAEVMSFSGLALTTPGVRNRRDLAAYLRLLGKLGWLKLQEIDLSLGSRGRTLRYYEVTEKGRAFLELFPREEGTKEAGQRQDAISCLILVPSGFAIESTKW